MAMKLVKKTAEYKIFMRGDDRYAIQDANGKPVNGEEKVRILVEEDLIKVTLPSPKEEAPESEDAADIGDEAAEVAAEADDAAEDSADKQAQLNDSDLDSADSGPKILMPPEEMLGVMPSEADSFGGYLLPYAGLVLLALALASAAFATLVLAG